MNFAFSEEQDQLREAVRKFLEAKSPESEVRRLMETTEGFDPAVWKQMANELGLQSLHIPEAYGGQGFTFVELGIVLEEQGRALLCAPYFSTVVLAANAILNAGSEDQKAALLPGIASGETIAALAFTEPNGRWDAEGITLEARPDGDGYVLDGTKMFVLDGHTADLIVVVARTAGSSGEDGISFFTVAGDADGLTRTALATMDQTRKQARLEFSGVKAAPLGDAGTGWAALSTTLDQAAVGLSNEMVGGAQLVLEESVQYAKDRVQFGRPIGSFQAIKHKCADMLLEVESAKSAAYYAAWAAAEANDEAPVVASLAKAYCSDAYFHAAAENIQIHGGIGFTWEHNAHLYFKRAKSSEILLGDATYHRELLAQRIGIERPVALIVGFVVVGLVLAIAAVFVFREAARMSEEPPDAVFDPDDAYEWVVRHLPDLVAATLTPPDVRRILDLQLEFFKRKGVSSNGSGVAPQGAVVFGTGETVEYIVERAAETGESYLPEQVEGVVECQLAYLRFIGAVGRAAGPDERPDDTVDAG